MEFRRIDPSGTPCWRWSQPLRMGFRGTVPSTYVVPALGYYDDATESKRLPAEFLQQGGRIFDRDKAVENFQVQGSVTAAPTTLGTLPYEIWTQEDTRSDYWHVISDCPMYRSGNTRIVLLSPVQPFRYCYGRDQLGGAAYSAFIGIYTAQTEFGPYHVPVWIHIGFSAQKDGKLSPDLGRWSCTVLVGGRSRSMRLQDAYTNTMSSIQVMDTASLYSRMLEKFSGTVTFAEAAEELAVVCEEIFALATSYLDANSPAPGSSWFNPWYIPRTVDELYGLPGGVSTPPDPNAIATLLLRLSRDSYWTDDEKSIIGRDLVEKYNAYSSNILAYVADFGKTGDTLRTLLKLPRNIKDPKAWASAWLSGRYGDRLAVQDTKELLEALQKEFKRLGDAIKCRTRSVKDLHVGPFQATCQRTSTVYAADTSFNEAMTTVNNLMRWDAWPTLENTWDLIPLSFLIDWFLPVSKLLGQIDSAVQAPYLRVLAAYVGELVTLTGNIVLDGCVVSVTSKYYRRYSHNALADIQPFTVEAGPPSFGVAQFGDALALLVQFRR